MGAEWDGGAAIRWSLDRRSDASASGPNPQGCGGAVKGRKPENCHK
ncbi:hypothetical protein R50072_04340 [Simiduia litorea]